MRFTAFGALAAALLAAAPLTAAAQADSDAKRCLAPAGNPDVTIRHCTNAIESHRYTGENLGRLHHSRAVEWAGKGDTGRALADYDAAIRLAPTLGDAYYNRATVWANRGESDRAIADYTAALKLDPKETAALAGRAIELSVKGEYAKAVADFDGALALDPKSVFALLGRGRARYYGADFQRAAADFEAAQKLDPNLYTALWLYLARKRAGPGAEDAIKPYAGAAGSNVWPAPLVALYTGKLPPEAIVAATAAPEFAKRAEQRCEAIFYAAQWHLLRNEPEHAAPLFREVQSACPKNIIEYEGALAELRRLPARQKP